jgi:multidrug efflux system outer membrane protein
LNAGYTSALDYAQAETLRAQTQVNLRELRRQRTIQEHQLANLTSNLSLKIEPGTIDDLPVPASPPSGLPSTLLERRPDVARDEQIMVASNAEIGVAKAAMFPSFGLTGAYGGQSFDLSDLLKAPFRFWNFGLGITGPIFAGGKYIARLDQARARNDEQIASYQNTVEGAFREVADALTNVAENNAAEPEVMTQVDAARRTLRLSRLRYQQGFAAYLDVLDATRQANLAELTLVQNRASRLNASVDLFRALGGGWSDAAVRQNPPGYGSAAPPSTTPVAAQSTNPPLSSR